jgi:hypothetical protein
MAWAWNDNFTEAEGREDVDFSYLITETELQ